MFSDNNPPNVESLTQGIFRNAVYFLCSSIKTQFDKDIVGALKKYLIHLVMNKKMNRINACGLQPK